MFLNTEQLPLKLILKFRCTTHKLHIKCLLIKISKLHFLAARSNLVRKNKSKKNSGDAVISQPVNFTKLRDFFNVSCIIRLESKVVVFFFFNYDIKQ